MSKKKKQHYVPQFYLRQFSINHDQKSIYTLDKENNNVFSSEIRNIGQGKYFNESEGYSLENYFSNIENKVAHPINKELDNLRTNNPIENHIEFKESINTFIITQYFRSLKMRNLFDLKEKESFNYFVNYLNFLLNNPNELNKFLNKPILGNKLDTYTKSCYFNYLFIEFYPKFINLSKDKEKLVQIKRIIDNNKNFLKFRKMNLMINKTDIPFITSDEPIIITEELNLMEYGFLNEETKIYMPLSPKYMIKIHGIHEKAKQILRMYPPESQNILLNLDLKELEKNDECFLNEPLEIEEINNKKLIKKMNNHQFKNSVRNVFSNNENILKNYNKNK